MLEKSSPCRAYPENTVDANSGQLVEDGAVSSEVLNVEDAAGMTAADTPKIPDGPFTRLHLAGLL